MNYKNQLNQFIRLVFVTLFTVILISISMACTTISGSLKAYAKAEQNYCDCLSGVLAPADEFCVEWSQDVTETREKLEQKLKRLEQQNPEQAAAMQIEADTIQAQRQRCLEAISKYYGGN